jgi:hypothetical protein
LGGDLLGEDYAIICLREVDEPVWRRCRAWVIWVVAGKAEELSDYEGGQGVGIFAFARDGDGQVAPVGSVWGDGDREGAAVADWDSYDVAGIISWDGLALVWVKEIGVGELDDLFNFSFLDLVQD